MAFILLALRNVFRNRRRSVLNIIALSLATCLMVLGLGWVEGYHSYVYRAMQNFESGEVQLIPEGYLQEERRLPLDLSLPGYQSLKTRLLAMPGNSGSQRPDRFFPAALEPQRVGLFGRPGY